LPQAPAPHQFSRGAMISELSSQATEWAPSDGRYGAEQQGQGGHFGQDAYGGYGDQRGMGQMCVCARAHRLTH